MSRLAVLTFVTLDGVMQAPGGPEEDPSGGFKHGGWVAGYWDDFLGNVMAEQMKGPFDLLLGRKTYELFAAFWPHAGADQLGGKELNSARKFVVSKTLKKLDWANSELVLGDVPNEIRKLKERDGHELQVHGSGRLIQTLLKNDLIDEFRLKIFPITLGAGKRLFAKGAMPAGFKLVDCKTSTRGVIVSNYKRDGEVKTGSFAPQQP
ncbi:MAG TPA: dihydrofolate reductase family protein [Candidatus Bathyarchaeia archaeon]|nr:dihydrofolate reductase family protein [Candidatus Bathyarchaeia archaeon]